MSGRNSFSKLRAKIDADPERRARMDEKRKAYDVLLRLSKLSELRQERGLTQAELIEALGVSQPAISKLETAATQGSVSGSDMLLSTLAGYVEATRGDDGEKNRLCPPSSYGNSLTDWARMNVRGARNTAAFSAEPDIKQWTDQIAINPARIPPEHPPSSRLDHVRGRLDRYLGAGVANLARLAGLPV